MKNNITRKTALKTICSLIIIILLSFNNFANAQVQNIPPELYTNGGLPNPLPKLENDPTTLWKFENETDCDLNMSMYLKLETIEVPKIYNDIYLPGTSGPALPSLFYVTSSTLHNYFGLTLESYNITNLVFEIVIGGSRIVVNPNQTVTIPNTPCGCLLWIPNLSTKTFTIKRC